jgi:hypothetical protein
MARERRVRRVCVAKAFSEKHESLGYLSDVSTATYGNRTDLSIRGHDLLDIIGQKITSIDFFCVPKTLTLVELKR